MDVALINPEIDKTDGLHEVVLCFIDKIDLRRPHKHILISDLIRYINREKY